MDYISSVLSVLMLIFIIYAILYYSYRWRRSGRLINMIPGPPSIPLLGNVLSVQVKTEEILNVVRKLNKDYYPFYKCWGIFNAVVQICHPDDAEVLLSSMRNIDKGIIYTLLHPWFQTGLLTSTGLKWQARRKILTPAFHFNVLRQFVDIFNEEGKRLTMSLKSSGGEVIKDLTPLISEHTLNVICETAMGTSLQGRGAFQYKYRAAVYRTGEAVVYRILRPWLYGFLFAFTKYGRIQTESLKILHGFTNKIIEERMQYHKDTDGKYLRCFEEDEGEKSDHLLEDFSAMRRKKRLAMLDLLIAAAQNGNQIDNTGIREEVDTFMFEGHDTTAVGLCFCLLLLAEHEDIQERVRQEVEQVWEANDGKMTLSMLQKLEFLERCIKESLRLYPSVPVIARRTKEDTQFNKYTVPAGTEILLYIIDIHRDPNFWPDPEKFDPDRFLPERIQGSHPYAYIPFSAGPRNCIGQRFAMLELKAMISHLVHDFYLKPVDRVSDTEFLANLVLRPINQIRVKFVPISTTSSDLIK